MSVKHAKRFLERNGHRIFRINARLEKATAGFDRMYWRAVHVLLG